jgi:hypothetical protein
MQLTKYLVNLLHSLSNGLSRLPSHPQHLSS